MKETVAINRVDNYDVELIKSVLLKQFSNFNIAVKKGMTVVIKVNLVMKSKPELAIITHPNVAAAAGLIFKEMGAKVLIAESSGGTYTSVIMKNIFSSCGYSEIAEKYGFELYTECKHESVLQENSSMCKTFDIVKPFINADYIVNIAKLKSHCMTVYSGAVKNLFGTVPGLMKPELHMRFPEPERFATMLIDLCEYIKPDISIIDAIDAMEGDGPTGGTPRHCAVLMSSNSPYALDTAGAYIAHMKNEEIPMLKNAIERKLCPKNISEINLIGDNIEDLIVKDFKKPKSKSVNFLDIVPKFIRPLAKKLTESKPVIRTNECIGCGKCAESCPAHTIDMSSKKAVIDYKKCIRCFCCHEMCPKHVIDVKKFSIFKW